MLRAIVGCSAVGIAAVIGGVVWVNTECSDGKVVRNSWQCVRNAGFEQAFCNGIFQTQEDAISRAPAVFPTESACRSRFPNCVANARPAGWAAKPTSFCVIRSAAGRPPRVVPYSG